jgi:hypothetical protein
MPGNRFGIGSVAAGRPRTTQESLWRSSPCSWALVGQYPSQRLLSTPAFRLSALSRGEDVLISSPRVVADIEKFPMQKINEAYERMLKSDVKYRFVIDLASLRG